MTIPPPAFSESDAPRHRLEREKAFVEMLLAMHEAKLLRSAHDLSNGGLAVALAEMSADGIGAHVELAEHADDADAAALLFGESQARAIVATADAGAVLRIAEQHGVSAKRIGHTAYGVFLIERNGVPLVRATANELTRVWHDAFALALST